MMDLKDIQQQIEKEYSVEDFENLAMETDYAAFANEDTCKVNEADAGAFYREGYIHGANFILSKWQESNRLEVKL